MSYTANPVNFDGTNDYLNRGAALSSVAASKNCTFNFWFRVTALATQRFVWGGGSSPTLAISLLAGGGLSLIMRNSGGTVICNITSTATYTTNTWTHAAGSVGLASTATRHLLLNGSSGLSVTTYTDDTVAFATPTEWRIGANDALGAKVNGDVADLWVAPGQYVDFSVAANLAKFYRNGAPANLGSDGSTPTGTAPAIFFSGATDTWQTNDGTGGGFTENGALTDGGTPLPTAPDYTQTAFQIFNDDGIGLGPQP